MAVKQLKTKRFKYSDDSKVTPLSSSEDDGALRTKARREHNGFDNTWKFVREGKILYWRISKQDMSLVVSEQQKL